MDLAENRFGKTWKHFLEVLKVDYNCSLADVCRDGLPTANGGKGGSSSGSTAGTSWYGGHDYSNVYDYSYSLPLGVTQRPAL